MTNKSFPNFADRLLTYLLGLVLMVLLSPPSSECHGRF